jgi:hypothetical protein
MVEYITRYQIIYKGVIKEAKKIVNHKYVSRAQNKMKAMWLLINEEVGKSLKCDKKTEFSSCTEIISDPQSVTDMLNTFFVEIIDELLGQNSKNNNAQLHKQRINCCQNTIFLYPVIEHEIECVIKSLKGKLSSGYDEIPECLVKKCINYVKNPLAHIFNASLSSDIFPDRLKFAKIIPLYKKGDVHYVKNYRPMSMLSVS